MKKCFILSALISLVIFTACNKQEVENDLVPDNPKFSSLDIDYSTYSHDEDNTVNTGIANFSIDNEDNTLYEKDALLLANSSTNAVSYKWDFGNGDISTEAHPNYKYKIHGYYTITLTITDAYGNTHQTSDEIRVFCIFGGGDHDQ